MLNVAGYISNSLSNGPGMRFVLFLQGCNFMCEGCHNQHSWDTKPNKLMSIEEVFNLIINECPIINGVTFSGGEPTLQSEELIELCKRIKEGTTLDIMLYTGNELEDMYTDKHRKLLLEEIDYIVTGKYEKNNIENKHIYAGSANQKFIIIKELLNKV